MTEKKLRTPGPKLIRSVLDGLAPTKTDEEIQAAISAGRWPFETSEQVMRVEIEVLKEMQRKQQLADNGQANK